jgi:hypothetical protein
MTYRVYVLEYRGMWREFGIDFPTYAAASAAAEAFRNQWPHHVYKVRTRR